MEESRLKVLEYKKYKSGEITVFLSLLFLLLVGFIALVLRSSKEESARQKMEAVSCIAIKSVFSEYSVYLYDKYGLLYIDTRYLGTEAGGADCLKEHVRDYVEVNLNEACSRLYDFNLYSVELSDICYARSDCYKSVKKQIRSYLVLNKGYSDSLSDDELINIYIDLKMPADFCDRFSEDSSPSYDDKLYEIIGEIGKDVRENSYGDFSFDSLIEGATVKIKFIDKENNIIECKRFYTLSTA